MAAEKKLYRARESIGGGVCTGIAEYFKIDPIVVQIITVILTLATGGLLAIAYLALWIILPKEPDPEAPVDARVHEVHSDTYGPVEYWKRQQESSAASSSKTTRTNYDPYISNAHVPPEPPKVSRDDQSVQNVSSSSPSGVYTSIPPMQPLYYQPPLSGGFEASSASVKREEKERAVAQGALWFGFLLLSLGLCALLGMLTTGVEWWQFWPLLFVIGGIGQMIVPGKRGHRKSKFANGLLQFTFGVAALPFSLGFIGVESLVLIFMNLWPILLIMCGMFILGGAMDIPLITLLGCFCFIVFCILGIMWFSYPGPTEMITLTLPTGQSYVFSMDMWR